MPGSGPPRQHQHVRIGAYGPFGEHDEDKQRRRPPTAPAAASAAPGDQQAAGHQQAEHDHRGVGMKTVQHDQRSRRADRPQASLTRSARSAPSSAGGPNMKPHTTSSAARMNPATTWKRVRADHRRTALQAGEGPEQREHDGGDREPAPQPDPRQAERRRGDDGEIDIERPEVRPLGRDQDRRDECSGDAETGQRRSVQQRGGERAERDQCQAG